MITSLRRLWCRLRGGHAPWASLDGRGIGGAGLCLFCGATWPALKWPEPPRPPPYERVRKGGYNAPPTAPRPEAPPAAPHAKRATAEGTP